MQENSFSDWSHIASRLNLFDETLTTRCAESVHSFLDAVHQLLRSFDDLFGREVDVSTQTYAYCRKEESLLTTEFLFVANCETVYESWRAASRRNADVGTFDGKSISELMNAINRLRLDKNAETNKTLVLAFHNLKREVDRLQHFVHVNKRVPIPVAAVCLNKTTDIPAWDADERVLRFQGRIVRSFAPSTSNNVKTILGAFNDDGWRTRIYDPLAPTDAENTKQALRTINKTLTGLKFCKDGDGIKWTSTSPDELPLNSPALGSKLQLVVYPHSLELFYGDFDSRHQRPDTVVSGNSNRNSRRAEHSDGLTTKANETRSSHLK